MHQTHAVGHRQYTFEEKSRRSFCPDGNLKNKKKKRKKESGIEREQQKQRIHVKREQKSLIKRKNIT